VGDAADAQLNPTTTEDYLHGGDALSHWLGGEDLSCHAPRSTAAAPCPDVLTMQPASFEEKVELIITEDKRYHRDAYFFVREALDHTQKLFVKSSKDGVHHVSGQQLLQGVREFALQQFGPMTLTVFEEWGILRCEDFGEIVFNMVENGLLAKTDADRKDDFRGGYDFEKAFREPFQPKPPQSPLAPKPKSTQV
jgi:uncharacterized repeat protein (TIGR04138 family)